MAFAMHIMNDYRLGCAIMLTLGNLQIPFAMARIHLSIVRNIYNGIYPKPPNDHENVLFNSVNAVFAPKGICPLVHAPLGTNFWRSVSSGLSRLLLASSQTDCYPLYSERH